MHKENERIQHLILQLEQSLEINSINEATKHLAALKKEFVSEPSEPIVPSIDWIQELPWAILLHDGEQVKYANSAALQLLGHRTLQGINLNPIWHYIHPGDPGKWKMRLRWVNMATGPMPWGASHIHPEPGRQVRVDGLSQKVTSSDENCYLEVLHPFDWDQKWKRWSSETEQRFEKVFESSPLGISMNGKDGHFLDVNPAFVSLFGYSQEELLDMTFADLTHPEDLLIDGDLSEKLFKGEISFSQIRKRYSHKDGSIIWGHLTTTLIKDDKGNVLYAIGMLENITRQRQATEDLKRSERYLANILNSPTNLIVFSLDTEFRYLAFNQNHKTEMKKIWGVEIHPGMFFLDLLSDLNDREKARFNFERALNGDEFTLEEVYGDEGLSRQFYENFYHPIRNGNGDIEGITVFVQDITERRKTELLIKENQRLLESINENISEGIYRSVPEKGLVYANHAFVHMFGYTSVEELLAIQPNTLFADPVQWKNGINKVINEGKVNNEEVQFLKKDGTSFHGLLTCTMHEEENGIVAFDGAIRDITQQKEAELAARNREQMIISISRNINEAIYRSSSNKGLLYINDAFIEIFGYDSKEELMAADPNLLYGDPVDRDLLGDMLTEQKEISNLEIQFRKRNGDLFWGLISSIVTEGDSVTYYDGAIRDITTQKNTQLELEYAKNLAEQMNQLKSDFLANMSHEIRTPINGIIGLAEIMEEEFKDNEVLGGYTGMLKQSGFRLLNTITSILDLSKSESKRVDIKLSEIKACEVLQALLPSLNVLASRKQLTLDWDDQDSKAIVQIDQQLLEQIFNNLIGNAIKFTSTGGVHIVTKRISNHEGNWWCCKVIDTGVGIEKDFLPYVFDSFEQESKGIGRKFEGTGLGLAIVKRYLEMYGGKIQVSSEKGKGSTFEFRLPMKTKDK